MMFSAIVVRCVYFLQRCPFKHFHLTYNFNFLSLMEMLHYCSFSLFWSVFISCQQLTLCHYTQKKCKAELFIICEQFIVLSVLHLIDFCFSAVLLCHPISLCNLSSHVLMLQTPCRNFSVTYNLTNFVCTQDIRSDASYEYEPIVDIADLDSRHSKGSQSPSKSRRNPPREVSVVDSPVGTHMFV